MSARKNEIPNQFQLVIMQRYMSDAQVREFYDEYKSHADHTYVARPPTAEEIRIGSMVREFGYRGTAAKVGMTPERIYSIFHRVAKYHFLNSR